MAGVVHGVKVYLNNKMIKFKSFLDYVKFYINHTDETQSKPPSKKKKASTTTATAAANDGDDDSVMVIDDEISDRRTVEEDSSDEKASIGLAAVPAAPKRKIIAHEKNERWEVVCVASDGQYQQVSRAWEYFGEAGI